MVAKADSDTAVVVGAEAAMAAKAMAVAVVAVTVVGEAALEETAGLVVVAERAAAAEEGWGSAGWGSEGAKAATGSGWEVAVGSVKEVEGAPGLVAEAVAHRAEAALAAAVVEARLESKRQRAVGPLP